MQMCIHYRDQNAEKVFNKKPRIFSTQLTQEPIWKGKTYHHLAELIMHRRVWEILIYPIPLKIISLVCSLTDFKN